MVRSIGCDLHDRGRDHPCSLVPGFPCPTHASAGGTAGQLPPISLKLPSSWLGDPPSLIRALCSNFPFCGLKMLKPQSTEPWWCLSGGKSPKLLAVIFYSPNRSRSPVPRGLCFYGLVFLNPHCTVENLREKNLGTLDPLPLCRLTYVYILQEIPPFFFRPGCDPVPPCLPGKSWCAPGSCCLTLFLINVLQLL